MYVKCKRMDEDKHMYVCLKIWKRETKNEDLYLPLTSILVQILKPKKNTK